MNSKFTQKIYLSLIAYESSIILGSLAKLYFSAGNTNFEDYNLIKEIFTKIKGDHVKTPNLKKIAKAIKMCLVKNVEVNYENLETIAEFKSSYKDKNSFLNTIQNQQIPTPDDLRVYLQTLDHTSQDLPTIDVALQNKQILESNPEFGTFLESIKEITDSIKKSEQQDDFKSGEEVMLEYEQVEAKRLAGEGFYTCGFQSIDKYLTEGFAPKQVTIVAARPGMGKSALCICMMRNLSKQGIPTAQFVLEMDSISYIDRYISIDGMIDLETLVKYPETLTDAQKQVKEEVKKGIRNNKSLYLRDKPSPSIKDIKEKIIKLQEKLKTKYIVIFIDLFDKIKNVTSKSDNMQGSFHISLNDLQTLAKDLEVHFVLVAQINRESEKSQTKRPGLANLKHSGAFEEVADIILFIDRPSYRILEEEIVEIDNAYQPTKYVDGFDYESLDSFVKKYDSEVFENITSDNIDTALQESVSTSSLKDDSTNLDSKLKESGMVKVGNIVIPVKEYAEVIIAKQRRGVANKIIPFIYKGQYSMFTSVNLVSPFSSSDK